MRVGISIRGSPFARETRHSTGKTGGPRVRQTTFGNKRIPNNCECTARHRGQHQHVDRTVPMAPDGISARNGSHIFRRKIPGVASPAAYMRHPSFDVSHHATHIEDGEFKQIAAPASRLLMITASCTLHLPMTPRRRRAPASGRSVSFGPTELRSTTAGRSGREPGTRSWRQTPPTSLPRSILS